MSHASDLLEAIGFKAEGCGAWGESPRLNGPGVYLVEWQEQVQTAPISLPNVAAWLARVPSLRLDGVRPKAAELAGRLARFWLPSQRVIYVGKASRSVRKRVGDYFDTPLGDARPHAGGHWVQTLNGLEHAVVYWCATRTPEADEMRLLKAFAGRVSSIEAAQLHDPKLILPFANKELEPGQRKSHGIEGSTLR